MNNNIAALSKLQKILLTLNELSGGTKKNIKFEDIVVHVFKNYPTEFQLRGYPQYPDSGDLIHKPLYDAKKRGLVNAGNKIFSLTDMGLEYVREVQAAVSGKQIRKTSRLPRYVEIEINRVMGLDGFKNMFLMNQTDKIIDVDFYSYLGVTVQTQRNDFLGRLSVMNDVVEQLKKTSMIQKEPVLDRLIDYHNFLMGKFKHELEFKSKA